MTTEKSDNSAKAGSALAPLRQPVFAVLWVATVLGNVGTFIRDVASAWLVTDLSASPTAVAMVQAAGTLPIFLLAIPAGVLSDILDRRRLLIVIQLCLAAVSATLALLAHSGELTVAGLVTLTFLGGVGAALMAPTWQAVVPELVAKPDLKNAVALNSIGFNIARAVGPAIGGLLLAGFGAAVTYGADVASYLLVICALLWWRRKSDAGDDLPEHFFGAFRAGLRYARASRPLHIVLLRAGLFFIFASSAWVLLPLVARNLLQGGPGFYGILLGAVGAGSILGAFILPALRRSFSADNLMLGAALLAATVMACLSLAPPQWLAVGVLLLLGVGWITALTTLNGITQGILPNWVRGRGLAIYLTVFNGALAAGSLLWGFVAEQIGIPNTLLAAAVALAVMAMLARSLPLPMGEEDLTPSNHWPEPLLAEPVAHDRGPVLITVTYRIRKDDRPAFWAALKSLAEVRRRDGAYAWGVSEDTADPEHIKEWFFVESWAEHLRQHRRVSHADADLQKDVLALHAGPDKPRVEHFLALEKPKA